MGMLRNPVKQKGDRNVLCSYYNHCLDNAVKKSWEDWDCGDCQFRWDQGARPELRFTADETVAYYDLPVEIYTELA